jgi:hypothetical protein
LGEQQQAAHGGSAGEPEKKATIDLFHDSIR